VAPVTTIMFTFLFDEVIKGRERPLTGPFSNGATHRS
jgi:hypothetical protein